MGLKGKRLGNTILTNWEKKFPGKKQTKQANKPKQIESHRAAWFQQKQCWGHQNEPIAQTLNIPAAGAVTSYWEQYLPSLTRTCKSYSRVHFPRPHWWTAVLWVLLFKANPSSYMHFTQPPLALKDKTSILPNLSHILRTFFSLPDHSHQPKNVPLFLLSLIVILITSKSPTATLHFSTLFGNKTPQNSCLFLETQLLVVPWNLKSSPIRFPHLPHTSKRAFFKVAISDLQWSIFIFDMAS